MQVKGILASGFFSFGETTSDFNDQINVSGAQQQLIPSLCLMLWVPESIEFLTKISCFHIENWFENFALQ